MWVAVAMCLVGAIGQLWLGDFLEGLVTLAFCAALVLLVLDPKPKPMSARALLGYGLLAVAAVGVWIPILQRIGH